MCSFSVRQKKDIIINKCHGNAGNLTEISRLPAFSFNQYLAAYIIIGQIMSTNSAGDREREGRGR